MWLQKDGTASGEAMAIMTGRRGQNVVRPIESMPEDIRWTLRPHVALECDDALKQVVAKQSQIGLSWNQLPRYMRLPASKRPHRYLADVIQVPEDVFQLSHLKDVLSLEIWNTCLSKSEKEHLYRFLPEGAEPEAVVAALLNGEDLNFGNPLSSWGSLVCSGAMHPDSVIAEQTGIQMNQKSYYSALHTYHQTLIGNLRHLKDLWSACKSPENICLEIDRWMKTRSMERPPSSQENSSAAPKFFSSKSSKRPSNGSSRGALDELHGSSEDITDELYLSQRLKKRRAAVPQSAIEKANAAVETAMNEWYKKHGGAINGEGIIESQAIKVSRKQFAGIMNRKQTGEEVRLDTLKDVLGGSRRWEMALKSGNVGDELLKNHWRTLVRKDLPEVYKAFTERSWERKKLATLVARQCIYKLPIIQHGTRESLTGKFDQANQAPYMQYYNQQASTSRVYTSLEEQSVKSSPRNSFEEGISVCNANEARKSQNGNQADLNVDHLLLYPKVRTPAEDDELASIQELWSCGYLDTLTG